MHEFLDFIKQCDVFTILTLGIFIWYISDHLKKSLEIKIQNIGTKIDNLDKDVRQMNTRIGRLEGTVYGKDVYKHTEEPRNTP